MLAGHEQCGTLDRVGPYAESQLRYCTFTALLFAIPADHGLEEGLYIKGPTPQALLTSACGKVLKSDHNVVLQISILGSGRHQAERCHRFHCGVGFLVGFCNRLVVDWH